MSDETSSTMPSVIIEIGQPRHQPGRREGDGAGIGEDPAVGGRATSRSSPRLGPAMLEHEAVRRPVARLLRWPGEGRGRRAVPAQRHRRQGHPRRAPRGGRPALLRPRRTQPDQRPEPGLDRRGRGRPGRRRRRPPGLLGQPQLGPLPARRPGADAVGRHHPGRRASSPAPTPPTAGAASTARTSPRPWPRSRTRPSSTGCGTTSTTRASSSRWSTPPSPCSPSCRRRPAGEGTSRS